jgi:Ca2+-binding EF-hand superfamily protein
MTETSSKTNLYTLFSYIQFIIDSPKEIKYYLQELYTCIIQKEDTLSLPHFHKFFKLPLIISSKLFYTFDKSKTNLLNITDFTKGMCTLFFPDKEIERLRLVFDFYDFDKNGLINKNDVKLILTHFHIMNNKCELRQLDYILERCFGHIDNEEINYMKWQALNQNNSDVYVLTLMYFFVYKPFYQDNVNFYIYNFISPTHDTNNRDEHIKDKEPRFNDPSLHKLFAESSEELYIYLNSQTPFTTQYLQMETFKKESLINNSFSDNEDELNKSTDSLNDLNCFENEKHNAIGKIEHTILSNSVFPNGEHSDVSLMSNRVNSTITNRKIVKNFFFSSIISNCKKDSLASFQFLNSERKQTELAKDLISSSFSNNNNKHNCFESFGRDKKTYSKNIYSDMGIHCEIEILLESFTEKGKRKPSSTFVTTINSSKTYEKLNLVFLNNEIYLIKTKSSNLYSYYNLNNSFFCLLSEKLINKAKYVAFTVLDYSVSESRETNVFCNSLVSLDNNCCEDFTIENKIFYSHPKDKQVLNNFLQNIPNEFKERVFYDYWDLIKEIGKGAFGKVFYGTKKGNPKTKAAIKLVKKVELYPQDVEFLNWELDVFAFLSHQEHPNLIKAIDKFEDPNYIYLLYEFISNSDIGSYIKQYKNEIKLTNIYSMSLDLITTIDYLHNFGIIHRDIKPDNILIRNIDDNGNIDIVLIDFGFSKVLPLNEKTNDICGSPVYLAPEILYNKPYNHLADIWSFGMTLYHLVYGELPFLNTNKDYLLKQYELINQKGFDIWKDNDEEMIQKRNKKNDIDPQLEFFKKVISKCLIPEYEKRISTKELIKLYQENVDLFEEGCITCY